MIRNDPARLAAHRRALAEGRGGTRRRIEAGRRICALREAMGLSQNALAALAETKQTSVSQAERGGIDGAGFRIANPATMHHWQIVLRHTLLKEWCRRIRAGEPRRIVPLAEIRADRPRVTEQERERLVTTGARLRLLRLSLHANQTAVARATGTSQTVVSACERGALSAQMAIATMHAANARIRAVLLRWRAERRQAPRSPERQPHAR